MSVARNRRPAPPRLVVRPRVGELGTIGATPAVVNAVVDALAAAGLGRQAEKVQMPLTAEPVWRASRGSHQGC